ncbi:MAG: PD-(D/E)XK nuclease family protein [Siphonobacter sp.]
MSFLSETATYIVNRHGIGNLANIRVILPSRRAVYFFKQELAILADQAFMAPEVLAMDDFVVQRANMQLIEPVGLLFTLYDTFKTIDPNLDFDRFSSWAPVVLRDFDQIDLYLANPKEVLSWVEAEKAILRWGQDLPTHENSYTSRYFHLFSNLLSVYEQLKEKLTENNQAYRGLAYRYLAEHVNEILIEKDTSSFHYFLGFNALSASESLLVKRLVAGNRGEALWDIDLFNLHRNHEAGRFIRNYLMDADLGKGEWNRRYRHWKETKPAEGLPDQLAHGTKQISSVSVTNVTMQPKVAAHFLKHWQETGAKPTALVLGDETLLMPTLRSLPESIADFNVTMGVSLRSTPLFTLVESLFELQRNVVIFRKKESDETIKIPKFSHRHITKILSHPFIRRYERTMGSSAIRHTLYTLHVESRIFIDDAELKTLGEDEPLFKVLFSRWEDDARRATQQLYALVDLLRPVYQEANDAIESEYLYEFYRILKQLERILAERTVPVTLKSFRRFLYELLRQTKIPFSGEPVAPLQIMGMLETRCLDFERVVILSMNEGVLPLGKKQNSLIPFDAAKELNLPTYDEADAIMSYHFFRLLKQAKEIVLVHTTPTDSQKAEPSRFLLQLEHELAQQNKNIEWKKWQAECKVPERTPFALEIIVPKTSEVKHEILRQLTDKGLFATHLNLYYECSLKYYFCRIAGVSEEEELTANLAANEFGTWVHDVLEQIDREMMKRNVHIYQPADYDQFIAQISSRLRKTFQEKFPGQQMEEGRNLLLYNVAKRILTQYFTLRKTEAEAGQEIQLLAPEQLLTTTFDYRGETIKVSGKIDRLERIGNVIRIIDYKTGKVDAKNLDIMPSVTPEELEEQFLNNQDWAYLRQLWLYKYLVLKQDNRRVGGVELSAEQLVQPGLISFRNLTAGFVAQENLRFRPDETPETFLIDSEAILTRFIDELLDETRPFVQVPDRKPCEFCDYIRICGRA